MPRKKNKIELADTLDGHWYKVGRKYYPSATTILNAYPQSLHLTKWIADQGWSEAQKIKSDAGVRGTNVHTGIENLLNGYELHKTSYSLDEWNRLVAFTGWYSEYRPQILETEVPLYSRKYGYAGRADVLCRIAGALMVGDWKTSGSIYDHFPLQVASYGAALEEMRKIKIDQTFILQVGSKNKNNYRYVLYPEWRDHFKIFLNVKKTWEYDNGVDEDFKPPVLVLPDTIKL